MINSLRNEGVLLFLGMLHFLLLVTSVIIGYKLVPLLGLAVSASIYVFPLSYACADIIAEIYGYHMTQLVLWMTFSCLMLFAFLIQFLLQLQPIGSWQAQTVYDLVLNGTLRLSFAVILSLVLANFINAKLLPKWKVLLKGRAFWLRSFGATAIAQAIDTLIGMTIAYLGVLPLIMLIHVTLSTYAIKLLLNGVLLMPTHLAVGYIKRHISRTEVVEHNHNPFTSS